MLRGHPVIELTLNKEILSEPRSQWTMLRHRAVHTDLKLQLKILWSLKKALAHTYGLNMHIE